MASVEDRLGELGITLPEAAAPAANYVPWVRSGNIVYVSGQISRHASGLILGRLGDDVDAAASGRVIPSSPRRSSTDAMCRSSLFDAGGH